MVPGLFMILSLVACSRGGMLFQSSRNISESSFAAATKKTVQVMMMKRLDGTLMTSSIKACSLESRWSWYNSDADGDQRWLCPAVPALRPVRGRGVQLLQPRPPVSPVPAGQPHLPGGRDISRLGSHWSRSIKTVLWLVGSWCCWPQLHKDTAKDKKCPL